MGFKQPGFHPLPPLPAHQQLPHASSSQCQLSVSAQVSPLPTAGASVHRCAHLPMEICMKYEVLMLVCMHVCIHVKTTG